LSQFLYHSATIRVGISVKNKQKEMGKVHKAKPLRARKYIKDEKLRKGLASRQNL